MLEDKEEGFSFLEDMESGLTGMERSLRGSEQEKHFPQFSQFNLSRMYAK